VLGRQRTGDESYVQNLLRELVPLQDGIRFSAVTAHPELVPEGIEAIDLPARSQVLRLVYRMPRLLRRLKPALAHFQYVVPPAWTGRSMITVHNDDFQFEPIHDRVALHALVPPSMKRSVSVLTVSQWTKEKIVERFKIPAEKVVVTPNGVDPIFRPDGPEEGGPPYLLFVGTIEPRKDPVAAVEALAMLEGDLRLILAGPLKHAAASVREAIERLGLGDRVQLRGNLQKDQLAKLYRGARCFVFPSRYEGFGLPILEAMACGTPVVTTTAGSIPEVAGDAAILVPVSDAEALADGVRRALEQRDVLRTAGLARAGQFSWAETARRTFEAYREALA
jgi:glycosyltransferase involved in cell wall biosynthesis